MAHTIHQGDAVAWAKSYNGEPFHALLCDPPYHLTEITQRFGAADAAPAQFGKDGAFQRASRGFMGKQWDGGDVAFRPETWAAYHRILHPGAFGMAFASSRGWHRMAVAIEDAGFIIHPTVFCWAFGSGFPKATKPADQYIARKMAAWLQAHPDAAAELAEARRAIRTAATGLTTAAREAFQRTKQRLSTAAGLTRVVGQAKHAPKFDAVGHGYREKDNGFNSRERETFDVIEYLDPVAAAWQGHRYGLQAMKPAIEPIIVFQKPYDGRAVECITETGAGALWIDGARVGTDDNRDRIGGGRKGNGAIYGDSDTYDSLSHPAGRWPANLVLSHLPQCDADVCAAGCTVAALGAQSGVSVSSVNVGQRTGKSAGRYGAFAGQSSVVMGHSDTGTAARYYHAADFVAEQLEAADALGYHAKASTTEREAGLDPEQIALIRLLYEDAADLPDFEDTTVGDGRHTPIDNAYQRGETTRRNPHATIKPISLTRWLATLLLPPDIIPDRRLFVPFAGTGSEMIGAMLAGWDHVVGVELEADHTPIARARLHYWQQNRHKFDQGQDIRIKKPRKADNTGMRDMFEEAA